MTRANVCERATPAEGLTFSGAVRHQMLHQLPSVGPPGDGGVLSPQPVNGQRVLHVLPPEAGRGGCTPFTSCPMGPCSLLFRMDAFHIVETERYSL